MKIKNILVVFLLLSVSLLISCGKSEYEELIGFYICNLAGEEQTITLSEGRKFELNVMETSAKGKYKISEETITFTIDGEKIEGTIKEGTIDLNFYGIAMQFIKKIDCIISFHSYGGSDVLDIITTSGNTIPKPDDPVKEGYVFAGWYKDIYRLEIWNFSQDRAPAKNITLYAKWDEPALTFTLINDGTAYSVSRNWESDNTTDIIIPEYYNNLPVKQIGERAFSACSFTSIIIPEGIESIGESAFYYCNELVSITLPSSLTSIGSSAFSNCFSLTNIIIPEGVVNIGSSAFSNCFSLTSIIIPEGVTNIAESAFSGCSSLTSITIPEGVTSIGKSAFHNCGSLTSIIIPEGVTSIDEVAFYGCSSLIIYCTVTSRPSAWHSDWNYSDRPVYWGVMETNVKKTNTMQYLIFNNEIIITRYTGNESILNIPNEIENLKVVSIGKSAFYDCSSLTSVMIPEGVSSIGKSALYDCSDLVNITLPSSLISIGESAFHGCSSLTSVMIPEGVSSIGLEAFYLCSSLIEITLPSTIISIGENAFLGCSSLTRIDVDTRNNDYSSVEGVLFNKDQTILICYPAGKNGSYTVPDTVKSIASFAFSRCSNITSVMIPEGVVSIGSRAFFNCYSLTSITISEGVTNIGESAFSGCIRLTSVSLPYTLTTIGSSAFSGCFRLTSVSLPYTLTTIGSSAFSGCSSLTSVMIPEGVVSIGESAFAYCSDLVNITLPSSLKSIDKSAFLYCYSLTSITILEGVANIDEDAFSKCDELTIYCAVASKPSSWSPKWNPDNRPVVWNYSGN